MREASHVDNPAKPNATAHHHGAESFDPFRKNSWKKRFLLFLLLFVLIVGLRVYQGSKLVSTNDLRSEISPTPTGKPYDLRSDATTKIYVSTRLKRRLFYNGEMHRDISEDNNSLYVDGKTGQHVEIFKKQKTETMEQAINRLLLSKYESTKCVVQPVGNNGRYEIKDLTRIYADDPFYCPDDYAAANGFREFVADPEDEDTFYFYNMGQYAGYWMIESSVDDTVFFTSPNKQYVLTGKIAGERNGANQYEYFFTDTKAHDSINLTAKLMNTPEYQALYSQLPDAFPVYYAAGTEGNNPAFQIARGSEIIDPSVITFRTLAQ